MGDLISLKELSAQKRYDELVTDFEELVKLGTETKCHFDLLRLHSIYDIDINDKKSMSDALNIMESLNKEYHKMINKMNKEEKLWEELN